MATMTAKNIDRDQVQSFFFTNRSADSDMQNFARGESWQFEFEEIVPSLQTNDSEEA